MDILVLLMLSLIAIVIVLIFASGIRVVREYERGVIYRLGRLLGAKGPGVFYIIPGFDKMVKVDQRVVTVDIPSQEAITRDNVTVKVSAVLFYKVENPVVAVNDVEAYAYAVAQAAMTSLRSLIGQYILDDLLRKRTQVNTRLSEIIHGMCSKWGIDVIGVETRDLEIPKVMQRAMAKEAEAERERRGRIIKAEGEFQAIEKLRKAAEVIEQNPASLELRRMQMITEVGVEQNTTTIILMPSDFVTMAKSISEIGLGKTKLTGEQKA
jgi:regulator of protease activity HflC (stomatin/prohibitin superfamily)